MSGSIAVVQDGLLQVQDSDSQTAVAYDDDTTITQQVSASLADVATGVCITGVSDVSGGEGSEALTTVMITDAVGGECSPGFGGMRGGANPGQEGAPDGAAPPRAGRCPGACRRICRSGPTVRRAAASAASRAAW
ncbi:hypothetical protein [Leucobacter soli]|uniref:hypothetical protein n=1 Tax=Leucobacter soli TaxID=2812850 RepID=UPI003617685B